MILAYNQEGVLRKLPNRPNEYSKRIPLTGINRNWFQESRIYSQIFPETQAAERTTCMQKYFTATIIADSNDVEL